MWLQPASAPWCTVQCGNACLRLVVTFDPWPLTLKTFSAMFIHMINMCVQFHYRPTETSRRAKHVLTCFHSFCGSHSSATDGAQRCCPVGCLVPGSLSTSLRLSATCSTGCRCVNGYYTMSLLPPSTVSVALALHTSSTFARWSLTSLVGRISVPPNAATCWSLVPEPNSADGASRLQHQPFGTLCLHTYARHWSVADSLEMGWSPICSQKPTSDPLRTYVLRVQSTYLLTNGQRTGTAYPKTYRFLPRILRWRRQLKLESWQLTLHCHLPPVKSAPLIKQIFLFLRYSCLSVVHH